MSILDPKKSKTQITSFSLGTLRTRGFKFHLTALSCMRKLLRNNFRLKKSNISDMQPRPWEINQIAKSPHLRVTLLSLSICPTMFQLIINYCKLNFKMESHQNIRFRIQAFADISTWRSLSRWRRRQHLCLAFVMIHLVDEQWTYTILTENRCLTCFSKRIKRSKHLKGRSGPRLSTKS